MDHFSTVLQRPPHFDEDGSNGAVSEDRGPRGGLRDILNPVSSTTQAPATPGAPAPPRPHSSFSLRSPTQPSDYHHPTAYAASPSAIGAQPSGSRSILNNPFGAAPSPSLPPPLQAPPSIVSATTSSGLQHPPRSPLHAPSVYYPSEIRDREPIRDKAGASSFYDPTTDSNRERERRVSETGSWRTSQASPPKVSKQAISILGKTFHAIARHQASPTFLCPQPHPSLHPLPHQPRPPIIRFPLHLASANPPIIGTPTRRHFFFVAQRTVTFRSRPALYFVTGFTDAKSFPRHFRLAILTTTPNHPPNTTTTGPTHPQRRHPIAPGVPSPISTIRRYGGPPAHQPDRQ
jgi:DNA helicase INO80